MSKLVTKVPCEIEGCSSAQANQGLCKRHLDIAHTLRWYLARMKVGNVALLQLLIELARPYQPTSEVLVKDQ
jgi:hypothetical protein